MSKFLYNSRVFDTQKSTWIFDYESGNSKVTLYKQQDGEWFYVYCENGHESASPLAPKYVNQILLNRGRRDLADRYFRGVKT